MPEKPETHMFQPLSRHFAFYAVLVLTPIFALLALTAGAGWWILCLICLGLSAVVFYDLHQTRHAIRRNSPVICNLRLLFESIRPELRLDRSGECSVGKECVA